MCNHSGIDESYPPSPSMGIVEDNLEISGPDHRIQDLPSVLPSARKAYPRKIGIRQAIACLILLRNYFAVWARIGTRRPQITQDKAGIRIRLNICFLLLKKTKHTNLTIGRFKIRPISRDKKSVVYSGSNHRVLYLLVLIKPRQWIWYVDARRIWWWTVMTVPLIGIGFRWVVLKAAYHCVSVGLNDP